MNLSRVLSLITIFMFIILLNLNLAGIKPVSAVKSVRKEHTDYLNVSGEFENLSDTEIIFSFPVCVKEVFVSENQYVNKGQAIFSIDKKRMMSIINSIYGEELLPFIHSELPAFPSSETLQSAIENIPSVVYTSDTGYIKYLNIESGGVYLPGSMLCSIESNNSVMAKFTVSQLDFDKINVGDKVDITPVAFSSKVYSGIISDKNAIIKKQSSVTGSKVVIDVFAYIDNPDDYISSGLQINGRIKKSNTEKLNTLDNNYIFQDEYGEYVFIFNKGMAQKVYVETGIETEEFTEIQTPFSSDTLFIDGNIEDKDKVIIVG